MAAGVKVNVQLTLPDAHAVEHLIEPHVSEPETIPLHRPHNEFVRWILEAEQLLVGGDKGQHNSRGIIVRLKDAKLFRVVKRPRKVSAVQPSDGLVALIQLYFGI